MLGLAESGLWGLNEPLKVILETTLKRFGRAQPEPWSYTLHRSIAFSSGTRGHTWQWLVSLLVSNSYPWTCTLAPDQSRTGWP